MRPAGSPLTILAAGPKGAHFVAALAERCALPTRIVSYPQKGDPASSYDAIKRTADTFAVPFETSTRPVFQSKELVLIVGWQYLLSASDADMVVFHDSLLPKYRGFAPTVTALIEGDRRLGVSALRLAQVVDAGPILAQRSIDIDYPIKIERAWRLQTDMMLDIALELVTAASTRSLHAVEQDEGDATLSLWRDEDDYWIDWSQGADRICRTIDALGHPYAGARTVLETRTLVIKDACVIDLPPVAIRQVGKFWTLDNGRPIVICGSGAVRVDRASFQGSIYRFDRLRSRFVSPMWNGLPKGSYR